MKTKTIDPIDKSVFGDIVKMIGNECGLELLDIVERIPNSGMLKSFEPHIVADFVWNGRMIKMKFENGKIDIWGREINLANPKSLEIIHDLIEELKKEPRMLPFHVGKPINA